MNIPGFIHDLEIVFFGAAPIAFIIALLIRALFNLSTSERTRNGGAVLAAWAGLTFWGILSIIGVTG